MSRNLHINLAHLPWPESVLKFNKAVHEMRPGDKMTANVSDADVVANLRQLLGSLADFLFDISQRDTDYHIRISKR